MQNLLQGVVDLGAPAQSLGERLSANRHDHEFLEVDVVVSMYAAVEDVHHGSGQQMSVRTANILVERQSCFLSSCTSGCQRDAQDGVGAEAALVVSAVEGDHRLDDVVGSGEETIMATIIDKIHPYAINKTPDGRYMTYIPDETKPNGRRQIKKKSKADLYRFLLAFYDVSEEADKKGNMPFEELYEEWKEYKCKFK